MKLFESNPAGKVLAGVAGGLAVISLLLMWAWSWPVSSRAPESQPEPLVIEETGSGEFKLRDLAEYREVNDRPVFNDSRQPAVILDEDTGEIEIEDGVVATQIDVRLTGVIITSDQRIATLTGSDAEPLIAHEGSPLDGQYVGWTVTRVEPRSVVLESVEGDSMEIELMVNDRVIAEPPKPQVQQEPERDDGGEFADEEEGEPSRADEIRRRIEERRQQLREEAEASQNENEGEEADQRSAYQQAIQGMMQRSNTTEKNTSGNDSEDE